VDRLRAIAVHTARLRATRDPGERKIERFTILLLQLTREDGGSDLH
jgi:hypothetical protein